MGNIDTELGWKIAIVVTLCLVAIFDFVIYPSWTGLNRTPILELVDKIRDLDPDIQRLIITETWREFQPYSLRGSGLFYLCMGSILTGVALKGFTHK